MSVLYNESRARIPALEGKYLGNVDWVPLA